MEKVQKIGFFKRIKMAIIDLEKYNIFLNEKVSVAFKYFFKLLLILVAIFSITTTIQLTTKVDVLLNYVKEEFPNFEYKDGVLAVDSFVNAYDKTYDSKLIVDTGDVSDEKMEEYTMIAEENSMSVILLKDKALIQANGIGAEIGYTDFFESIGTTTLTKTEVVNKYNESGFLFKIGLGIYIYSFLVLYVQYFCVVLENVLIVMLFGWLAALIVGVKLKLSKALVFAIYSLTLSSILNVIYSIVAAFTGFEIKYFSLMYLIIGYIYMMAVILIHKADILENSKKVQEKNIENLEENKNENVDKVIEGEVLETIVYENEKKDIKTEETKKTNKKKDNKDNKDNKDIKNEDNKE